jgi:hypothetical protein
MHATLQFQITCNVFINGSKAHVTFTINIYNKPSSPRLSRNCSIYIDWVNKPYVLLQALSHVLPRFNESRRKNAMPPRRDWPRRHDFGLEDIPYKGGTNLIKYSLVFHTSQVESIFKVSILPIYIYIHQHYILFLSFADGAHSQKSKPPLFDGDVKFLKVFVFKIRMLSKFSKRLSARKGEGRERERGGSPKTIINYRSK